MVTMAVASNYYIFLVSKSAWNRIKARLVYMGYGVFAGHPLIVTPVF